MNSFRRSELIDILNEVSAGASSSNSTVDTEGIIAFDSGRVFSYNGVVASSCKIDSSEPLRGQYPLTPLLGLLQKLPGDLVTMVCSGNELLISSGHTHAGLLALSEENKVPKIHLPEIWGKLQKGTLEALEMAAASASDKTGQSILNFVSVQKDRVVGCDDISLTVVTIPKLGSWPLIPAYVVPEILFLNPILFAVGTGWIHFVNSKGNTLSCKTAEGKYPDVSKLLEREGTPIKLPKGLTIILDRALVLSNTRFDEDCRVTISCKKGELTVSGKGDNGWYKESVPFKGTQTFTLRIHPKHLQRALKLSAKATLCETALKLVGDNFTHLVSL